MYKHKPTILEYIRANTRKMFCPLGGATLYEDMSYISGGKRERDAALAEEAIRLFKIQKAEETNAFNEKQQRKIDDWL